jgi:Arm DNA-binding domain
MPRDRLSDTKIRQAKPGPRAYKLADGGGLFVLVHPNGSRYWRLKYRSNGKEKLFAIGVYPEISLAQARAKALEARQLIRDGADPVMERRRRRSEAGSETATFQAS